MSVCTRTPHLRSTRVNESNKFAKTPFVKDRRRGESTEEVRICAGVEWLRFGPGSEVAETEQVAQRQPVTADLEAPHSLTRAGGVAGLFHVLFVPVILIVSDGDTIASAPALQ
ncbi:hypothetical protein J6590_069259 [Homalodisca vitripennis]|nr:hypothetical protein J6590_069259 [Homalodisca vitripennis]